MCIHWGTLADVRWGIRLEVCWGGGGGGGGGGERRLQGDKVVGMQLHVYIHRAIRICVVEMCRSVDFSKSDCMP